MSKIRLAIVDDSHFIRKAIARLLAGDSEIQVVGAASTGEELIEHLEKWRPGVITLDLSMPGMGGMRTLDCLMKQYPVPVIILSTHSGRDAPDTIEALSRGAVDFIDKQQYSLVDFEALRAVLREKILHVTGATSSADAPPRRIQDPEPVVVTTADVRTGSFDAVVIGASTGGPPAIERILADLGGPPFVPIAVVQHMSPGFTRAFADRLNANLSMDVHEAEDGEPFIGHNVYIAPTGSHMTIERWDDGMHIVLSPDPEDLLHRPSVDVLFQSAARVYGDRVLGVLLTGMGRDGAEGMVALADAGAYTLAQDEATSIVFGMPRAAVERGGVNEVISLTGIGERIRQLLG